MKQKASLRLSAPLCTSVPCPSLSACAFLVILTLPSYLEKDK